MNSAIHIEAGYKLYAQLLAAWTDLFEDTRETRRARPRIHARIAALRVCCVFESA